MGGYVIGWNETLLRTSLVVKLGSTSFVWTTDVRSRVVHTYDVRSHRLPSTWVKSNFPEWKARLKTE